MNAALAPSPRWLTWVGILFLAWNLMGIAAFVSQSTMSAADIAALPQQQRDLWVSMPGWAWVAYAIAVFVAIIGSIGLILRKWWAPLAYSVSLIAVIIQFSYPFLLAQGAQTDLGMLAFPIFIVVMGVLQWQLSRAWQRKGWLG
ncbi:MAG TPA: hypothetical protein VGN36_04370 [Sphingorhabdus sp.]|jgi:hypothetical protein|nr:hypothetical protein [Sphingorhabdus sp.]